MNLIRDISHFSNLEGNLLRGGRLRSLPHYVNRTQQDGGTSAGPGRSHFIPTAITSRDIVSIPPSAPPLRRPPPPQFTAPGISPAPRQYKRRMQRSPSPPVMPPVFTPLMEMGFSVSHIESAIQSQDTGMYICHYPESYVNDLTHKVSALFHLFVTFWIFFLQVYCSVLSLKHHLFYIMQRF